MVMIAIYKDEYHKKPNENYKVFTASDDTEILHLEEFEEFKEITIFLKKGEQKCAKK